MVIVGSSAILLAGLAMVQERAIPGDPWSVVYESDEKLHAVSLNGQEPRSFGSVPKLALDAYRRSALSPDGKTWACVTTEDGDADLWLCGIDGANPLRITTNSDIDNMPCWQPDGRKMLFASTQSGKWQIWAVGANGKDMLKLTDSPHGAWEPRCNPKNGTMAYLEFVGPPPGAKTNLVVSKLDGTGRRVLLEQTSLREYSWSPDGTSLACSLPGEIFTINAETGKETGKLALEVISPELAGTTARFPTWRPDQGALAASIGGSRVASDPRWNGILVWPKDGKPQLLPLEGRIRVHTWRHEK